ncbi:MAG: ribulose-phosphate 3-epimerase, partial [Proteobacteria bacterium]|nr:ribulose-phosphate 3-epimerase [Pseudomonadota bacterium]
NPGFGGQSFIEETIGRVTELKAHLESIGRDRQVLIEVDGGVNTLNAPALIKAGAKILVAGTSVYGAADRAMAIRLLKGS